MAPGELETKQQLLTWHALNLTSSMCGLKNLAATKEEEEEEEEGQSGPTHTSSTALLLSVNTPQTLRLTASGAVPVCLAPPPPHQTIRHSCTCL